MPKCTNSSVSLGRLGRQAIEADFCGGDLSSDAGLMLLRLADQRLGLIDQVALCIDDDRDASRCRHSLADLLRQRVFAIAQGYEDLNDHGELRADRLMQSALGRTEAGASAPTLCRFENRCTRQTAVAVSQVLVEQFIARHTTPPTELILDFDATDDAVHGEQEGRFFHGYYDHYCFLPLYVFCGDDLLVAYLRPSKIDGALHAWAILKLLVNRLRQAWPDVRLIFRGDSGFCRHQMLTWCERHQVDYLVGLARNARVTRLLEPTLVEAEAAFAATGEKQRHFADLRYGAKSWGRERRVIGKAEVTVHGRNPRYIVTSLAGDGQRLYDERYCARGEMENRIKEQQLGLFADRTSAHAWWSNQCRVLLSALAYVLLQAIRRLALAGTEMARAQVTTLRLRLLKVAAAVTINTRRIRLLLPNHYPHQTLWRTVAERLLLSG